MICVMIRSERSTSSWMMRICSADIGLPCLSAALQREGGVVDDGQRVLDLVGELGRQPAGGAQLAFAHGELARFLHGPPLAFQQHLHAVAADRHQQQHHQAQHKRLAPMASSGARQAQGSGARSRSGNCRHGDALKADSGSTGGWRQVQE